MDVKNFIVLVFVLSMTEQLYSKSIQNVTSLDEDSINSRLELLETKLTVLENESEYKYTFFCVLSCNSVDKKKSDIYCTNNISVSQ